ncbi:MAG: hypothetical protein QME28_08755 [Candidatus Saccharicenans sp.]|nr:hypothetical protein [Candidatus Saccharicenans sp.]
MRNNTKIKAVTLLVVFAMVFGLVPAISLAAVTTYLPAGTETDCFKKFEQCVNNVRTSFPGSTIDFLDCELALIKCIKDIITK